MMRRPGIDRERVYRVPPLATPAAGSAVFAARPCSVMPRSASTSASGSAAVASLEPIPPSLVS